MNALIGAGTNTGGGNPASTPHGHSHTHGHGLLYKRAVAELASCVHKSVFALKLLPPDACPSLICILM